MFLEEEITAFSQTVPNINPLAAQTVRKRSQLSVKARGSV